MDDASRLAKLETNVETLLREFREHRAEQLDGAKLLAGVAEKAKQNEQRLNRLHRGLYTVLCAAVPGAGAFAWFKGFLG